MKRTLLFGISTLLLAACSNNNSEFEASGTFEATEVTISAEATGRIMQFNVEEGDKIQAGTVLGFIDSTQLYLQKLQLKANLRTVDIQKPDIQKQIAVVRQQISTAEMEQKRQLNLVRAKAGNQKKLDDIENQLKVLRSELAAQQSTLNKTSGGADAKAEAIQYQIMQLDDQLMKSRIYNPITGTVLVKYAEAGEVTAPGHPLYKIADTELIYLRAYITANQLSALKLGQTVRVFADYEDDYKEYEGKISWISAKAEFTPKGIQTKNERANLVYAIKIAVHNDGLLKIGQYGEVKW